MEDGIGAIVLPRLPMNLWEGMRVPGILPLPDEHVRRIISQVAEAVECEMIVKEECGVCDG